MSITRRRFISITASAALYSGGGFAFAKSQQPTIWQGVVLGADAKIVITALEKSKAEHLIELALTEVNRLEDIFSLYRSNTAISRLNNAGKLTVPPAEMLTLFSVIEGIHKSTDGLFDPTIQPLWSAYAEHRGTPPNLQLKDALARVGWEKVEASSQQIRFKQAGMAMTLNGIAQGFITDRITALLKREGLTNAVVAMGEISALGTRANGKPWEIAIGRKGGQSVQLTNKSIATSSLAGTTFDGKASHILHPKTGFATKRKRDLASVIHPSAAIADGLSTAALLMSSSQLTHLRETYRDAELFFSN